jgi:hypothetical protein
VHDRDDIIGIPRFGANRRFGLLLAVVCLLVFGLLLYYGTTSAGWAVTAGLLLLVALLMPRVLAPLRRLWLTLGGALHVVMSPVLLAAFYYGAVVPVGLAMRLFGRDPLRRKRGGATYWIERDPRTTDPQAMRELF